MKRALLSYESVINMDMNMAYNSNELEHQSIATLKYRRFPNQRSRGNGVSMTWQIMENNYILTAISSLPSTEPDKSEGLLTLKEKNESLPITGKEPATEPHGKRLLYPFTKEVSAECFFLMWVWAVMCPKIILLKSKILLTE